MLIKKHLVRAINPFDDEELQAQHRSQRQQLA
jgi:hypothetical protein